MYVLFVAAVALARCGESVLLYPASTVLQMIGSVSVPINVLAPPQKALFDWGFQMNYDMPFNLSTFYMVPIWSTRGHALRPERDLHVQDDYMLDEFYVGLEYFLERWGFHKTCLNRSICELAQHPFDDTDFNLLTNLVTYLLTPSLLDVPPNAQRNVYRTAEIHGLLGHKCHQHYPECVDSLLSTFTEINESYL